MSLPLLARKGLIQLGKGNSRMRKAAHPLYLLEETSPNYYCSFGGNRGRSGPFVCSTPRARAGVPRETRELLDRENRPWHPKPGEFQNDRGHHGSAASPGVQE